MPVMSFLTTCIFDHGAVTKLSGVMQKLGVTRPLIITDKGIKAAGILDTVLDAMASEPAAVFADTVPNPTEDQAIATAALYKEIGADGLIAFCLLYTSPSPRDS